MAYLKINGAASDVVAFAGGVLTVTTGHGARFVHAVHGAPSPERPLLLQCGVRGADIASAYLECTGRDGDSLAVELLSGTVVPGHVVAADVDAAWWDEPPESIAGLLSAGDNVTVTGDGTAASPYVVAATGAGGEPGPPGDAATVSVGTVATGAAGSPASVVNSGTSSAAVLDFAIPQGATGADGAAATVAIGSVSTLPPGSPATAVNVGTPSAAVIDLGIPQGAVGATGGTGAKGDKGDAATIAVGAVTGLAPGNTPTVTNVGTSGAAVFDFAIPEGMPGASIPGAKGDPGDAATISVGTVTTGAAGSSAAVTNSGTSSAAVLDFAIPRGATGTAGTAATVAVGTVTTGAAGSSATVTNAGTSSAAVLDFAIPQGATGPAGPEKRTRALLFRLAADSAGTVGDLPGFALVPWPATINYIKAWCSANPTSAIAANVKTVGGVNVHSSGLSIAGGATGPDEKTSGFPPSLAKDTKLTATSTALPADATWVFVEIELREAD